MSEGETKTAIQKENRTPEQLFSKASEIVRGIYKVGPYSQSSIHIEVGGVNKNPFEHPSFQEQSILLETFKDGNKIIVVNPVHGNEPYILATNVALSINEILKQAGVPEADVVVPLLYPGRQEKILKEEFSAHTGRIFLDSKLGDLFKQILFKDGRFDDHLLSIVQNQERLQNEIRNYLSREFKATSLATSEIREFNGRDIALDINAGSRFLTSSDSYYVFPALFSEILQEVTKTNLPFDRNLLNAAQRVASDMEEQYRAKFIPQINTFSFKDKHPKKDKTFIPPLKHPMRPSQNIEEKSLYVVASGTGSQVNTVLRSAQELGLKIYRSPFINLDYGEAALPDIVYHPNVVAVFGRMGWGTGWLSQQAGKPFIVPPYEFPDDPEVFFNIKTLRKMRLGRVYQGQKDIIRKALELTGDIQELNSAIYQQFGTMDGIDFVAQKIVEDLHRKRKELSDRLKP